MDYHAGYIDGARGFFTDDYGNIIVCPACGSSDLTEQGTWFECGSCGHGFKNPYASLEGERT
jgi:hypothetical protein